MLKVKVENCTNVLLSLIGQLRLPITQETISSEIKGHPDYPSLLSVSDACKLLGINNLVLRGSNEQLKEYPLPFIAQVKDKDNSYFVVVKSIDTNGVCISKYTELGWQTWSIVDFMEKWSNVLMLIDTPNKLAKQDYQRLYTRKRFTIATFALLSFTAIVYFIYAYITAFLSHNSSDFIVYSVYLVSQMVGVAITSLLLWHEIDKSSPAINKLCGRNSMCSSVLQSDGSKIFGVIGFSELGWAYFAGNFLFIIQGRYWDEGASLLSRVSITSIAFIFYSIFYQWKIVRSWCRLCLIAISSLGVSFVASLFILRQSHFPSWYQLPALLYYYLFCLAICFAIKAAAITKSQLFQHKTTLSRLKKNEELFNLTLTRQQKVDQTQIDNMGIKLGNEGANFRIIKVCNLYCLPCITSMMELNSWILDGLDFSLQIVFSTRNSPNDKAFLPTQQLIAIYQSGDKELLRIAIQDWHNYGMHNPLLFLSKYKTIQEAPEWDINIQDMQDWCRKIGITHTPTYFINGFKLPEAYRLQDLKYFLLK